VGKIEDIPNVKFFIFTSGSDIFSIGGNTDGVNVSFMGFEGISDLEVGAPDFKSSIPTNRGKVGSESLVLSFSGLVAWSHDW